MTALESCRAYDHPYISGRVRLRRIDGALKERMVHGRGRVGVGMGRKLLVGMLLVMVAITVPLAQAGSAGGLFTPAQARTQYDAAKSKAGCTTLAEKTATRGDVALLALGRAAQAYAKDHNISAIDEDTLLQAPARTEIVARAVKLYRKYLQYLGHRMILSRSADCTRSIIAFVNGSGLHIVAEEELAQAASGPLELTPGPGYDYSGASGPGPVDLTDGINHAPDCCTAFFDNPNTLWGWGMTQIAVALMAIGVPAFSTTPTAPMVLGALMLAGKGVMDLERALENGAGLGASSAGDRER